MTVLHVEDDENDAILLQKACERANVPLVLFRVTDAEKAKLYLSGESIFSDRVQYPAPQIMILDLKLPCMTGFELLQWIRSKPEFQALPVLVFTSSLSRDDKAKAMSDGASSYFVKPSSFEALVQMVGAFGVPDRDRLN